MPTETVLVVGSTGNIGISAVIGALDTKRDVLAVVRNQESAEKLFKHVGTREGITVAEADITSEADMLRLMEDVKAGKLPAFQHVYAAGKTRKRRTYVVIARRPRLQHLAGGLMGPTPLHELTTDELRHYMNINFETNFCEYLIVRRQAHHLLIDMSSRLQSYYPIPARTRPQRQYLDPLHRRHG